MSVSDVCEVKKPNGFGIRHLQTLMWFFAMVLGYGMRVNMSMAIVVMTDSALENSFNWSMQIQSVILSSFFWGYIVLQVPAGEMAARYGGRILILIAISINALVSLAIPYCAYFGGWQLVCACRVVQGLSQGFLMPSIYNNVGKWAPVEEKSRIGAVINSGSQLGNAIQMLVSGFIAAAWGWPAIFYVNGVAGIVWVVVYAIVGADTPQKSKLISDEERLYIQSSLGQIGKPKKLKTPWKAIWSSIPFLSLIVLHCSQNWGYWTLMTEMPSYMKKVLNVDIKANGVMSSLPYLMVYILSFPFGFLADYLPNKKWLTVTATRKLSNSIGYYGPAIALIGLSYVPAGNVTMAVVLLTVVVGLNVGHLTGLMMVHLDMSPNFAGTLLGITNMAANIISIIAPLVAGVILQDETDLKEWRNVFYIASAIWFAGNTFYLFLGTSEKQPWNEPPEDCTTTDETPEKHAGKVV
ncbi:putative inorganic phosphate cotransporter [Anticarsia gemmatalis]|uniref:putative inorganic phosphate cotransporter n=1 Tax=Anticarsia gemmatalis TaxID=129554 RepID=UPI003F7632F5